MRTLGSVPFCVTRGIPNFNTFNSHQSRFRFRSLVSVAKPSVAILPLSLSLSSLAEETLVGNSISERVAALAKSRINIHAQDHRSLSRCVLDARRIAAAPRHPSLSQPYVIPTVFVSVYKTSSLEITSGIVIRFRMKLGKAFQCTQSYLSSIRIDRIPSS